MERKEKQLIEGERNIRQNKEKTFDRIKREHQTEKGERIPLATIAQKIRANSGQESPTVSPRSHLIMLQHT